MSGLEVLRLPVRKYAKSGRVIAIKRVAGLQGVAVIEFSSNLTQLTSFRFQNSVRGDLSSTEYTAEIEMKRWEVGAQPMASFRLLRMLLPEDLSLSRWTSAASLDDLPVSSHPYETEEERFWAGERKGNFVACGVLIIFLLGCLIAAATSAYKGSIGGILGYGLPAAIALYALWTHKWRPSRRPHVDRLAQLRAHKASLRELDQARLRRAKSEFDRQLLEFETWASLTPKEFEFAITRLLEREGFSDARATQYSRDGGVDVTATDPDGRPTIVQAKRYASRVGVASVRELAGVRQMQGDDARAILFALEGFSRDAVSTAAQLNIELRDVRSMLQHSADAGQTHPQRSTGPLSSADPG